jgi:hypothetical protein
MSTDDITPYDLASRLVDGLPVSAAGQREVAAELLRWQETIEAALEWHTAKLGDRPSHDKLCDAIDTARAKESR